MAISSASASSSSASVIVVSITVTAQSSGSIDTPRSKPSSMSRTTSAPYSPSVSIVPDAQITPPSRRSIVSTVPTGTAPSWAPWSCGVHRRGQGPSPSQ